MSNQEPTTMDVPEAVTRVSQVRERLQRATEKFRADTAGTRAMGFMELAIQNTATLRSMEADVEALSVLLALSDPGGTHGA